MISAEEVRKRQRTFTMAEAPLLLLAILSALAFIDQIHSMVVYRDFSPRVRAMLPHLVPTPAEAFQTLAGVALSLILLRNLKLRRWASWGAAAIYILLLMAGVLAAVEAVFLPAMMKEGQDRGSMLLVAAPVVLIMGTVGLIGVRGHLKSLAVDREHASLT
jgi:hypothetical protein